MNEGESIHVVVLDTSHLSDLAREPDHPSVAALIRPLQTGEASLAISIFHLLELADPAFRDVGRVRALLADVSHVLANPFENVAEEEIASACAAACGRSRRSPRVFARDTSEWGYRNGPIGGNAVEMLDAFRVMPEQRSQIREMAASGAQHSMIKHDAALVRDPLLPLTLSVRDHLAGLRRRDPGYAGGLTAEEVITRVGGKAAFPACSVQEALVAERMKDRGQKSSANDVFDEYIAFYAPYAAVTTVDRGTFHRARMARLSCVDRMTWHLADVAGILDAVRAGRLTPVSSTF